ncbi:MAG: c-type cytochrome, partial [Acidobacteria bacterium]|nr:c-type cytochrome [Acidobacteriota bacterium]MDW7985339.1 c-type cytochrome [Acidobacteriota bacterium]
TPWSGQDPNLSHLRVGLLTDTPAETIAAHYKFTRVVPYPLSPAGACALFADLHKGKIDAVLTWAPLAGYFVALTDEENRLQALPVPQPLPAPQWPKSASEGTSVSDSDLLRCADRIQDVLESYGVPPAELLTANVAESSAIPGQPPPEDLAAARLGETLYYRYCDRCHGAQAVLGRRGLELRQRFLQLSYPEFIRAVWEGRPGRGMPAYRGLLDWTQMQALYQYLRALTMGKIEPRKSSD